MVNFFYKNKRLIIGTVFTFAFFLMSIGSLQADTINTSVFIVPFGTPAGPVPDRYPPAISNVLIRNVSFDGATITWETNEPTRAVFHYGLSQRYETDSMV